MYLANTFANIYHHSPSSYIFKNIDTNEKSVFHYAYKSAIDIVKNYELFTFEKSALIAASDIRLDKPQGLEQISELVFSKPRKIFIETSYAERKQLFSKLNLHSRESDLIEIGDPNRVGLIINILGNGVAKVKVTWVTPKKLVKQHLDKDTMRDLGLVKNDSKFFLNLTALNFSAFEICIDTKNIKNTTIEEYEQLLNKNDDVAVSINTYIENKNLLFGQSALQRGWQLYRLNQFSSLHLSSDGALHAALMTRGLSNNELNSFLDTLKEDLNGEMIFTIAMLAVLEIENLNIKQISAQNIVRNHRYIKGHKSNLNSQDINLGIVSLDIDKSLERHMTPVTHREQVDHNSNERKSPIIHPVRGHLFRSRNGKIVYRKPHWRGKSRDINFIKRVR